jgi:hypothetical protein
MVEKRASQYQRSNHPSGPFSNCIFSSGRSPISHLRSAISHLRPLTVLFRVLLSLLLLVTLLTHGEGVTLAWDPNSESDLEGYRLHYGFRSRTYVVTTDVGNVTTNTVFLPFGGETYFFAVTAYNTNKLESDFSNEVPYLAPEEPGTSVTTTNLSLWTEEDQSIAILWESQVLDRDSTIVYVATPPTLGRVIGTATNLTYEPGPDRYGLDQCQLILVDTNRNVLKLELSIEIAPVNDPPIAYDSYEWADSTLPITIFLSAYDPDDDTLSFIILSGPSHGHVEGEPPQLTYWPNADYIGMDELTFRVTDGEFESNDATVSIQVELINSPPVAGDLELSTNEDQPLEIVLPVFDPDGDPLFIYILEGPSAGTLSGVPPELVYTPSANYYGPDGFTYIAEDEHSSSGLAYVTITVLPVNDPPVISPTSFATDEDTPLELHFSVTDADGDPVQLRSITAPAHGRLTGDLPLLLYTPATNYHGLDSFRIEASDGQGPAVRTTVSILIRPINDRPVAHSATVEMNQAETANIRLQATDVDGDSLIYRLIDQPRYGRLSGAAPDLEYRPPVTFSGTDQFSFAVSDGILESSPATVLIQVLPLEDPTALVPYIIGSDVVSDRARITWTSWIGGVYRIRQRSSLARPGWKPILEEIEAVGLLSTAEIPLASGASESYYSVELVR